MTDEAAARQTLLGRLRQATRVALDLRPHLLAVLDKTTDGEVLAALQEANQQRAATEGVNGQTSLLALAQAIDEAVQATPMLFGGYAGEAQRLKTALDAAHLGWPSGNQVPVIMVNASETANALHDVVLNAAYLTIPDEARAHLANKRQGDTLDFAETFKDELPDEVDRAAVLQWLAANPGVIPTGVVDTVNSQIVKLPTGTTQRAWLYIVPFIEAAASVGVLALLAYAFSDDSPIGRFGPLFHTYWLVLLGVVGHLLIDTGKRSRYQWLTAVQRPARWTHWWLLHAYSIGLIFIAPLATAVLLRALEVSFDNEGVATIILAGFSADSIADLAFARVNALSAAATKTITAKLPSGT